MTSAPYPTSQGLIRAKDVREGDVLVLPDHVGRVGYVRLVTGLRLGPLTSYLHMHIFDLETGQMLYGIIRGELEWVQLGSIPERFRDESESGR